MKIVLNGEPRELERPVSAEQLLRQLGMMGPNVALALNEDFVPRSNYGTTLIDDGDRLEIVAPMQGG